MPCRIPHNFSTRRSFLFSTPALPTQAMSSDAFPPLSGFGIESDPVRHRAADDRFQALYSPFIVFHAAIASQPAPLELLRHNERCARPRKWVQNQVSGV